MMTRMPLSLTQALAATLTLASFAAAAVVGYDGDDQKPATQTQSQAPEHVSVAFSDPTQPGKLKVNLLAASVTVKGYAGKEVVVDARMDSDEAEEKETRQERSGGMHRIRNASASGLEIEEERNLMIIRTGMPGHRAIRLTIQVPTRTSLDLSVVNDGNIIVDGVDGDIVANNVNGAVTLTNISGAVVAHALNEDVKATFTRYSGKPMSFSSLNGTLDVTLPADTKATLKLQSDNGEVYSDFPVEMLAPSVNQTVRDDRSKGGKYRLKIEKTITGRINGGGPEITFKTFNGDIKLHRGGASGAGSAH
jgi:hypothetical protein